MTAAPAIRRLAVRALEPVTGALKFLADPYRPERHYMRGRGPRWHARHRADARPLAAAAGLLARAHQTRIELRAARAGLESALYGGRYRLVSKNDDDLPIAR